MSRLPFCGSNIGAPLPEKQTKGGQPRRSKCRCRCFTHARLASGCLRIDPMQATARVTTKSLRNKWKCSDSSHQGEKALPSLSSEFSYVRVEPFWFQLRELHPFHLPEPVQDTVCYYVENVPGGLWPCLWSMDRLIVSKLASNEFAWHYLLPIAWSWTCLRRLAFPKQCRRSSKCDHATPWHQWLSRQGFWEFTAPTRINLSLTVQEGI